MSHDAGDMPGYDEELTLGTSRLSMAPTFVPVPRLQLFIRREGAKPCDRVLEVQGDRIAVGSHPRNDVVLDDRRVSRFHCVLTLTGRSWKLSDSGSLNGTTLNGIVVRDATLPTTDCELGMGDSVLRIVQLTPDKVRQVPSVARFGELRGSGLAMRQVFSDLERVAPSDVTVLIRGESGTGKELVAREIANRSSRANGPIITVDCSAISSTLIESELFGHARGAFTGAEKTRVGAFEAAHRGTIFLDEIGEMPLDMQPKLLRALENREIRRAGENEVRKIDVRVIAATNRDLEREVNRGRFREDLYFRLSVFSVRLPPLRERLHDLSDLIEAFLERMGATDSGTLFTDEVYQQLMRHDWPGNVRELRNYVERALVMRDARSPTRRDRQSSSPPPPAPDSPSAPSPTMGADMMDGPFKELKEQVIAEFERKYLHRLMQTAAGNISLAARIAKLDRMYLYRLLERHSVERGDNAPSTD